MLGSMANALFGTVPQPEPTNSWVARTDFVPAPGQTAYGFTFSWSPAIGHHCRVSVGHYPTLPEAHEALARGLAAMMYQEPSWWQFWRWGSAKLPPEVSRTVSALIEQHQPTSAENKAAV